MQQFRRRSAGLPHQCKECGQITVFQCLCLRSRPFALCKEMCRTENGTVGTGLSQPRNGFPELLCGNLPQDRLSEISGNLLHLRRNRHIIRCQIGVAALGICDAQTVSCLCKVKGMLLYHRFFRVRKIDPDETAYGTDHLIHQATLLAEIYIFRILSDLGNFHCTGFSAVVMLVDDRSHQHLKRCRGGKPAAAEHLRSGVSIPAAEGYTHICKFRSDSPNQCRGSAFLLRLL